MRGAKYRGDKKKGSERHKTRDSNKIVERVSDDYVNRQGNQPKPCDH